MISTAVVRSTPRNHVLKLQGNLSSGAGRLYPESVECVLRKIAGASGVVDQFKSSASGPSIFAIVLLALP